MEYLQQLFAVLQYLRMKARLELDPALLNVAPPTSFVPPGISLSFLCLFVNLAIRGSWTRLHLL